MILRIAYIPNTGITIDNTELNWGTKREVARKLLGNYHKAQDSKYDFTDISLKRDIYKNYKTQGSFFFLNYNENNCLNEVEVHAGVEIVIGNVLLSFEKELSDILTDLQTVSPVFIKTSDGEYFFKDLKLSVSDSEAMGSDGSTLGYFYCSANVDHLAEE
jgi:hypothetical protein